VDTYGKLIDSHELWLQQFSQAPLAPTLLKPGRLPKLQVRLQIWVAHIISSKHRFKYQQFHLLWTKCNVQHLKIRGKETNLLLSAQRLGSHADLLVWGKYDWRILPTEPKRIGQSCLHLESFFLWAHQQFSVLVQTLQIRYLN